jgi:hypothetical protein
MHGETVKKKCKMCFSSRNRGLHLRTKLCSLLSDADPHKTLQQQQTQHNYVAAYTRYSTECHPDWQFKYHSFQRNKIYQLVSCEVARETTPLWCSSSSTPLKLAFDSIRLNKPDELSGLPNRTSRPTDRPTVFVINILYLNPSLVTSDTRVRLCMKVIQLCFNTRLTKIWN